MSSSRFPPINPNKSPPKKSQKLSSSGGSSSSSSVKVPPLPVLTKAQNAQNAASLRVEKCKADTARAERQQLLADQRRAQEVKDRQSSIIDHAKKVGIGTNKEEWGRNQMSSRQASAAAKLEGLKYSQQLLSITAKRLANNRDPFPAAGRSSKFKGSKNSQLIDHIAANITEQEAKGVSSRIATKSRNSTIVVAPGNQRDIPGSVCEFLRRTHREFMVKHYTNPNDMPARMMEPFSTTDVQAVTKLLLPKVVLAKKEDRVGARRNQSTNDGYQYVSVAAGQIAMFKLADLNEMTINEIETLCVELGFDKDDMANFDKSTALLNARDGATKDKIACSSSAYVAEKAAKHQSVATPASNVGNDSQVTVGYTLTSTAAGHTPVAVVHIKDHSQLSQRVYTLNCYNLQISVIMSGDDEAGDPVKESDLVIRIIMGVLKKRRWDKLLDKLTAEHQNELPGRSAERTVAGQAANRIVARTHRIARGEALEGNAEDNAREAAEDKKQVSAFLNTLICYFDGELNNLNSVLVGMTDAECEEERLLLAKLASALSLRVQPQDLTTVFKNCHKFWASDEFLNFDYEGYAFKPSFMKQVDAMLKNVPPARRFWFRNFLCLLPAAISRYATVSVVQKGWALSSLWPPSPEQCMSMYWKWQFFSKNEQQYVFDAIKLVAGQMIDAQAPGVEDGRAFAGTACDNYMELLLEPLFGKILMGVNNEPANGRQTTDHQLGRWRFTFLCKSVRDELLKRLEFENNEILRKEQARAAKSAAKIAKEVYDATPDGQRKLQEARVVKEVKAVEAARKAEFQRNYPGQKYTKAAAPPQAWLCSYCQVSYVDHVHQNEWKVCNVMRCMLQGCKIRTCSQLTDCSTGFEQHIAEVKTNNVVPLAPRGPEVDGDDGDGDGDDGVDVGADANV